MSDPDVSAVNEHLASQVPSARAPAAGSGNSTPPAQSASSQSAPDPAHGTLAFIDGSSGRDGFSYVGRPGVARGFSGQEPTPRYSVEDSGND
jgi:hypothetical protein